MIRSKFQNSEHKLFEYGISRCSNVKKLQTPHLVNKKIKKNKKNCEKK